MVGLRIEECVIMYGGGLSGCSTLQADTPVQFTSIRIKDDIAEIKKLPARMKTRKIKTLGRRERGKTKVKQVKVRKVRCRQKYSATASTAKMYFAGTKWLVSVVSVSWARSRSGGGGVDQVSRIIFRTELYKRTLSHLGKKKSLKTVA